jgi:hypothetical protein
MAASSFATPTMTSEGQILNDRYRLESQLGSGGMGSVWCAQDIVLERHAALKEVVHFDDGHLAERRTRAVREARALARVSHPAIVRIHDIFFAGSDPWIVMEYIKGRSLAALIRNGSLGEREVARIGLTVLSGLSAAHAAGVVHRDVKPTNILITDDNEVFLVDFGIAKISGDMSLTGQSKVLGTPEYLAPEQILGQPVGAPADLWSLGVTFFCALEGYSPFRREGDRPAAATMMAVLHDDPPRAARLGRLTGIVLRLLKKQPEQRADAKELALALRAIADEGAPGPGSFRRPSPRPAMRPRGPGMPGWPAQPPRSRPQPARPSARPPQDGGATVPVTSPAADAVRRADPQAAVPLLLAMPEHRAAQVLGGLSGKDAGARIEAVAAAHPETARAILVMLTSARAGRAVDYLSLDTAVAVMAGLPEEEAARILARADVRTAAAVVMKLPIASSARLIHAMPGKLAAGILEFVTPLTVATLLTTSDLHAPDTLSQVLLSLLKPPFRAQVSRYLPRPDEPTPGSGRQGRVL